MSYEERTNCFPRSRCDARHLILRKPREKYGTPAECYVYRNGISTLPHSSGVLCALKEYAASLKQTLKKIVQNLLQDRKSRLIDLLGKERNDIDESNYFQSRPVWRASAASARGRFRSGAFVVGCVWRRSSAFSACSTSIFAIHSDVSTKTVTPVRNVWTIIGSCYLKHLTILRTLYSLVSVHMNGESSIQALHPAFSEFLSDIQLIRAKILQVLP